MTVFGSPWSLLSTAGVLICVTLLVSWCRFQWTHRRLIKLAKTLPTIRPTMPLFGHMLAMYKPPFDVLTSFVLSIMMSAASKGVDTFCLWVGPKPYIFIQRPEDIQVILNRSQSLHKGEMYRLMEFSIGGGLLVAPVDKWRVIRRNLVPIFRPSNLEHVVPSSNHTARKVVKLLEENATHGPVDVLPLMRAPSLFNISCLIVGTECIQALLKIPEFLNIATISIMRMLDLWCQRFLKPWLYSECVFKILFKKDIKEIYAVCHRHTVSVLQAHKEQTETKQDEKSSSTSGGKCQLTIFQAFAALNQASPTFDDEYFQHEMITLCAAGTNSTSVTLSSCMLALASYPDIQEKLYREIVSVTGSSKEEDITIQHISQMPYLDMVLKETMRKFTVFPFIQRRATEDLHLSFGVVPAGSNCIIGLSGTHMNPNIHSDPHQFDPERFSPENIAKRHKYSFIPFSVGPRNCIAGGYATLFIKIVITHVVKNYKFFTNDDISRVRFRYIIEAQREEGYSIWVEERS